MVAYSSARVTSADHRSGMKKAAFVLLVAACALVLTKPAYAQVCPEPNAGSGDRTTQGCDHAYRQTELMCDLFTIYPSCPAKPVAMLRTAKKSYIKDYSPYLFSFARDPEDKARPYSGQFYRGTPGDAGQTFQLFGKSPRSVNRRMAACVPQIKFGSEPTTPEEEAKMVRMELDNCTNQYILNSALYPYQKENTQLLSGENPANAGERISLRSHCQPLRTATERTNEYFASDYLKAAWIKLLQDPTYRKTPGAAKEPHLPDGITLDNPIAPPSPFPDVRLSSITAVPYEEINDPTHPFSPRWDFKYNERDFYSPKVAPYQNPTENAVFCAGARKASGGTAQEQADATVKVDVLEFRRRPFDRGIMSRINFNTQCFNDNTTLSGAIPMVAAQSYCYQITSQVSAQAIPCWQCFGMSRGQKANAENESTKPPCATHHGGTDRSIIGYVPGAKNGGQRRAVCSTDGRRHAEYDINTLCRDLRAPFTQINKLKMRYHNPARPDDVVMHEGVAEGMRFNEYFGNHMPYPRLFDTGRSIQRTNSDQQNPTDTEGQYTAIVGVGHEGAPKRLLDASPQPASNATRQQIADRLKMEDQRCLLGGWGEAATFGGASISLPDPIASWTELKLYQTRTAREVGLSCLGRYEKVFKMGSSENMVLARLGAEYAEGIISDCKPGSNDCNYRTLADERAGKGSTSASDRVRITQLQSESWPLALRGYLASSKSAERFPKIGGSGAGLTGLDRAELGDIVLLATGGAPTNAKPGLPKVGVVAEINLPSGSDCAKRKNCYVKVIEADNGKWPDVCGTTGSWGEMKTRYLYKPGHLPSNAAEEYQRIGATKSCEDTNLLRCELSTWDDTEVYRVREDIRRGNDGTEQRSKPR